ncbi:hypothetical protein FIBSPDRAFT_1052147 [Athelia psychrophila]|uniref:Uncharacterized protein n=1 Tax=Athelia psychrophila TaxID=1759441 RepID=A0A165XTR3_9AGAM|nr:hypothetical protein FIBSPDRAFT_1052147 [Fibularhizoctonia sp. CBS 109695]
MGLFHVYVQSAKHQYTLTIAFVSHEVADEWWRAMSTHPEMSQWIKRISPQLYVWTGPNRHIDLYDPHKDGISQFADKMVNLWQSDSISNGLNGRNTHTTYGTLGIIPVQDTTDQTSGNSFFIRSKVEPYEYWYCPTTAGSITEGAKIYTTREERTRFRVRINDGKMQPGTIMIGTDEIFVSPVFAPTLYVDVANGVARMMSVNCEGEREHKTFKLSDVRTGFISGARVMDDENDFDIVVRELVEALDGDGEGWELV